MRIYKCVSHLFICAHINEGDYKRIKLYTLNEGDYKRIKLYTYKTLPEAQDYIRIKTHLA